MLSQLINLLIVKAKIFLIKRKNTNTQLGKGFTLDLRTKIQVGKNKLSIGENVYLRSISNGYHAGMPFPTTILIDKTGAECIVGDNCRINGAYIHAQKKL